MIDNATHTLHTARGLDDHLVKSFACYRTFEEHDTAMGADLHFQRIDAGLRGQSGFYFRLQRQIIRHFFRRRSFGVNDDSIIEPRNT